MEKTIHFICTGNTYRSRMAEAYFNSLNLPGLKAISSGIEATHNPYEGPIQWAAMRIIHNNNFDEFMSHDSKLTTLDMLNKGDFTVFMQQVHFDFCKNDLKYVPAYYQIWDVEDIRPSQLTDQQVIDVSEKTFALIRHNIDELVKNLTE